MIKKASYKVVSECKPKELLNSLDVLSNRLVNSLRLHIANMADSN